MGVAYREDTDEVKQAMFDAFDALKTHPEQGVNVIGDFEWFGLDQFADSAVILRARIRTLPGKQWGVGRAYNEIVKRIFDARGIEIPFPHTTLYWGENKKGETQPIRLQSDRE
jgi:small-conductance mechanosensitive channel